MKSLTDECIKIMARQAISQQKGFEYMLFWMKESQAWQQRAKDIFQRELSKTGELF